MKFLFNTVSENHLNLLLEKLKTSDEACMAIAFLKSSGLNKLLPAITNSLRCGKHMTIVAGQNFALTEPEALHTLRKLFIDYPSSKVYLAKADVATCIFHPKLYLFKAGDSCCIVSGSANITEGGLEKNVESSLVADCPATSKLWRDAKQFFDTLISTENADEATLLIIKQYENFFEQQKKHNKQSRSVPAKTKAQIAFNYQNLIRHFKEFDDEKRDQLFEKKMEDYREAKKLLDRIADSKTLTQNEFAPILDKLVGSKKATRLWHSGSLFRLRKKVYPYYTEFADLIRGIRENRAKSAASVFNDAKEKVKKIKGAAVNYIAEVMMTYNQQDFANMNSNPITVLREEGGVNLKSHSSQFSGNDYEQYCELVKEISVKLGLRNMLEADTLFNEIYWKIK
jgi:HKD family nuclease